MAEKRRPQTQLREQSSQGKPPAEHTKLRPDLEVMGRLRYRSKWVNAEASKALSASTGRAAGCSRDKA